MNNSLALDPRDRTAIFGSVLICTGVLSCFLAVSPSCRHWFVVPVLLCGILITRDAVRWCFADRGSFDIEGLVGIAGFNFFFFSPLLLIASGMGMPYVSPPPAWEPLIGKMACFNFVGIAFYQFARRLRLPAVLEPRIRTFWSLAPHGTLVLGAGLLVALLFQVVIFAKMGGISGYLSVRDGDGPSMAGMGILLLFGGPLPFIAACLLFTKWSKQRYAPPTGLLIPVLVVLLILQIVCGGLRGSRASVLWSFLLILAAVNFHVRPIPKRWFLMAGFLAYFPHISFEISRAFPGLVGLKGLVSAATTCVAMRLGRLFPNDCTAWSHGEAMSSLV